MIEGRPSVTARTVARLRLGFERLPYSLGDPAADEALASDVASYQEGDGSSGDGLATWAPDAAQAMQRYLAARTTFFDRVVVNAIERGTAQFVNVGAGYDGRSLRYGAPGTRWFEVDHPSTQEDKARRMQRLGLAAPGLSLVPFDLTDCGTARRPSLAAALLAAGLEPDAPTLVVCEGVVVYLAPPVIAGMLCELRALATAGTRLALSTTSAASTAGAATSARQMFRQSAEHKGEPALNDMGPVEITAALEQARWQAVEISERAARAGFLVASPVWSPARQEGTQTAGTVGRFLETVFHRSAGPGLAAHLASTYGLVSPQLRQLDVGTFRLTSPGEADYVARVFPAARPEATVRAEAAVLSWLVSQGYPAERPSPVDPVTLFDGQAVLLTEWAPGKRPATTAATARQLGDLLGRLHVMVPPPELARHPGGGWHHVTVGGSPADEVARTTELLEAAGRRVRPEQRAAYERLVRDVEAVDACADLPHALVHPDFVPANVVAGEAGLTVLDWSGTGLGPRLWSFGFLLWAVAAKSMACVDAAVQGYLDHVGLSREELERLDRAVAGRPLTLQAWSWALGRQGLDETVEAVEQARKMSAKIADRARRSAR